MHRKKEAVLALWWSRPASFLLDQNILLTQFNLQTRLKGLRSPIHQ